VTFKEKIIETISQKKSYVCVGLDTDVDRIPDAVTGSPFERILAFNKAIIDATADYASAYKLNSAFYEAAFTDGLAALKETVGAVPNDAITIVDVKRGDIGSTAAQYAKSVFEVQGADAVTLNPYMGYDSIEPFLAYEGKGCFILCLTSNKGADDFQKLILGNGNPFYLEVVRKVASWNRSENLGIVAGATRPDELAAIREIASDMPFLIPGIGKQGGDLERTVSAGIGKKRSPALINSSRSIIYCSSGKNFARAARAECKRLRDGINEILDDLG